MSRSDKGVPVFGEKGGFAVGKDGEVNTVGAAIGRPIFMGSLYYHSTLYTAGAAGALTFVPCDKSKQKRTGVPEVRKNKKSPRSCDILPSGGQEANDRLILYLYIGDF